MPLRGVRAGDVRSIVLAACVLAAAAGCAAPGKSAGLQAPRGTYHGPSRPVGAGWASAFVTLGRSGKPAEIGVRLSEAALTGLPAQPPPGAESHEYGLELPAEAAGSGYDHVAIDWNPRGHMPKGAYDVPHLDFRFYLIGRAQRERIAFVGDDAARARRLPPPQYLPVGYVLAPGTGAARVGAHAIRPAGPEFNGQPFTKAFNYGFYDGTMVFLEPMIARAFLETRPEVSERVSVPDAYSRRAYYPASYSVRFDPGRREFVVALGGLLPR